MKPSNLILRTLIFPKARLHFLRSLLAIVIILFSAIGSKANVKSCASQFTNEKMQYKHFGPDLVMPKLNRQLSKALDLFAHEAALVRDNPSISSVEVEPMRKALKLLMLVLPKVIEDVKIGAEESFLAFKAHSERLMNSLTSGQEGGFLADAYEKNLPQKTIEMKARIFSHVEEAQSLLKRVTELDEYLRLNGQFPIWFLYKSETPWHTQPVFSAVSSSEVQSQWALATTSVEEPSGPTFSRFFVLALNRNPRDKFLRDVWIGSTVMAGLAVGPDAFSDLAVSPENVHLKQLHSISYIGPNSRGTFATIGFILDVPQSNILSTSLKDAGNFVQSVRPNLLADLNARKLLGPDELLRYSHDNYNELMVVGQHPTTGAKISVRGMYYRLDYNGQPKITPDELLALKDYCTKHRLPPPFAVAGPVKFREQNIAIDAWYAAIELVKMAKLKNENSFGEWNFETQHVMEKWDLSIPRDMSAIYQYIDIYKAWGGKYMLSLKDKPPYSLLFPRSKIMPRQDFLRSYGLK